MSKLITTSKLNRLWKNGILPIKQSVDNHKTETNKAISDINTALEVMDEKVDGVVESGLGSKIVCTCTGDNAVGTVLTGTLNGESYRATIGSDGKATFMISDCGKFVITGTEDYKFKAVTVDVLYFGIYYVSIKALAFVYTGWLAAAGLSTSSYADLDAVLADEKAVRTLMTKTAAVDYMVAGLEENAEAAAMILANDYVAKWVNYREYAYSSLGAVAAIKSVMDETGKYGFYWTCSDGEWQPKGLVPVMTSNTAPYGEAILSANYSDGYEAYRVFNRDNEEIFNSCISKAGTDGYWIGYKFTSPTIVKRLTLTFYSGDAVTSGALKLQGSNNGTTWSDITSFTAQTVFTLQSFNVDNNTAYMYYRILSSSGTHYSTVVKFNYIGLTELQFYGRQLEALVPPMTSNTAPVGEASASSAYFNDSRPAWKAFSTETLDNSIGTGYWYPNINENNSWLAYDFKNPTIVNAFEMTCAATTAGNVQIKLQAYVNGSWVDVHTETRSILASELLSNFKKHIYVFDTDVVAEKWRMMVVGSNTLAAHAAQFYGAPDYDSRTYIYDHGVEVMEVSIDNDNGAIIEKQPDKLYMKCVNTKTVDSLYIPNAELAEYKLITVRMDKELLARSDGAFYGLSISSTMVTQDNGSTVTMASALGTKPVTYLDITSITQQGYINISVDTAGMTNTISEWWLE